MKIEGKAVEYFMQWIGNALKPLLDEDAETDVLAKYIITMLSTDDNEQTLREHCVSQLTDFLSDETEKFVTALFEAIKRSPYKESLPHDAHRYQAADDHDDGGAGAEHSSRRRGRDGSDEDGSDDEWSRRRRGGGGSGSRRGRGYDAEEDDYDYKRPRGSYDDGRYTSGAGRARSPPPQDSRYDRGGGYDRSDDRRSMHGGYHSDSRDRGPSRNEHIRGGRGHVPNAGAAPMPRGPAPPLAYMGGMGGGDGYGQLPYPGGGPPFGPPLGAFNGGYGPYDPGPFDQAYHPFPPAGPPPLPPMPPPGGLLAPGMRGDRPLPPLPSQHAPRPGRGGAAIPPQRGNRFVSDGDDHHQTLVFHGVPVQHGQESHTVRCTGIPQNIQEKDLFRHFKTFGRIASLKLVKQLSSQGGDGVEGRKTYNECYVQFIDPHNAKNCVTAPSAVLNNRYIKVFLSNQNVIEPGEAIDSNISYARGYDGSEGNSNNPRDREKQEVQRRYEELKKLRAQEESILKKQETLLEGQIEQHNKILAKLEYVENSEEKNKMTETLESKIMTLQFKLREVREKRDASRLATEQQAQVATAQPADGQSASGSEQATTNSVARFSSQRGRGAPRGRFGGKGGRGRFGRGVGSMSLDCRPKALVVSNIPDGFNDVADQHFARFGKVLAIEGHNDSGIKVEFSSRYDAERALKEGAGFGGNMLTLEWADNSYAPSEASRSRGDSEEVS